MPPKYASTAGLPGRTSRNTAPKSISNPSYSTSIDSRPPSSATAGIPPPSTATLASPELSHENLPVNSAHTENPPQTSRTNLVSQTQTQNSQEALYKNSVPVKSDVHRININNHVEKETLVRPEKETFEHFGPEEIIHVGSETVEGGGNGAGNGAVPSGQVNMPHAKDDSSIQPESTASGVVAPGQGKRKIVKKTVRIVKKVIKKRVPKRVLTSASQNQGFLENAENGVKLNEVTENFNLVSNVSEKSDHVDEAAAENSLVNEVKEGSEIADEVTENSSFVNNVIEKSNLVDDVTKKTGLVNEVMEQPNIPKSNLVDEVTEKTSIGDTIEKSKIASEVMETSKLDSAAHDVEPISGEKGNDVSDINSMEAEASQFNSDARASVPVISMKGDLSCLEEMEKSKVNVGTRVPQEMVSGEGNCPSDVRSLETDNMRITDDTAGVDIKELNVCNPVSMEVEKINHAAESTTDSEKTKEIGDYVIESALKDSVVVNQNDIVDKEDVGQVGDESADSVGEENRSTLGGPRSSEVESKIAGLEEGPRLSGEMEALERKKKRKTEIFIGGLDKDTKEDDIRKVFEQVGTVVEVRLVMNSKTGKNKGFAFVRFAAAADAKNALEKYSKVEICGKMSDAAAVEGNDTIFLGNIDRKWKTEDVVQLLERAGIEKIDNITLKVDPNNIEKNRGFAFVELETNKDAQIAFSKLQKKNVLGKNLKIKVAWAQPLIEPDEEEMLKVKSVYAEYLPSSWDEEKVKEYFGRFGDIESVVLAKDLPSSRRNDFAFINYTTRDAALVCIEAIGRERLENQGAKVKMTASLAKPNSRSKQIKHVSNLTGKQFSKGNVKSSQAATIKRHEPKNKGKRASSTRPKVDPSSSTTDELVQILRQQASSHHIAPPQSIATCISDHRFPLPGSKRPFSLVGHDPLYLEHRRLPRGHIESSYHIPGTSASSHGLNRASFPYHHQHGPGFSSESVLERNMYPIHFQTREQAPFYGNNSLYRRN